MGQFTSIFIAGDVVNYQIEDGHVCGKKLAAIISECNYSICNFEAPIEGFGEPILKSGPHHYQRKSTLAGLKEQGFDMVLLANNHMMDYGPTGASETKKAAEKQGLDTIGVGLNHKEAYAPVVKKLNGLTIGIINACEAQFGVLDYASSDNEAGYAWINHDKIDKQVIDLKKRCDYVIVLAHAGLENYSVPQREWRQRYKHFCDLGADAVIGSHPHVPQGYEKHNDSVIFYSLGNFYFDSEKYINRHDSSYSVILKFSEEAMDWELVFHDKSSGLVEITDSPVDMNELCNRLKDPTYTSLHDEMSYATYSKVINNLELSISKGPFGGSWKSTIKRLLIGTIRGFGEYKKRRKDTNQLHMLRNEAYYYAARSALELKYRSNQK